MPEAFRQAAQSLVAVRATFPAERANLSLAGADPVFWNGGLFVAPDGAVLTSLLAVAGCSDISVVRLDGRSAPARVRAYDQASGLALLDTQHADGRVLAHAPADGQLGWGLLASVAREAGGLTARLEPGLVVGREAAVRLNGLRWEGLLLSAHRVRQGAGAAPLLDAQGRLVGVLLAARPGAGLYDCYSLPAERVAAVVERLLTGESRRLGWLGLAVVSEGADTEGARVIGVLEGSPAESAGLRPGDVLLAVDDRAIDSAAALRDCLVAMGPRDGVRLGVLRGDELLGLHADVGPRPLLICSASRDDSSGLVRPARRGPSGGTFAARGADPVARQLLEENRRLREQLRALEAALTRLRRAQADE